jgi:hypothetical protein
VECDKCGSKEKVQEHHIIPKGLKEIEGGDVVWLCEKHHNILHLQLLNVITTIFLYAWGEVMMLKIYGLNLHQLASQMDLLWDTREKMLLKKCFAKKYVQEKYLWKRLNIR